jgi:hypothetical protein
MLVLVPSLGAIAGTAWSVSHPAEKVEYGLVVGEASFWGVFETALIGGLAGVVLLIALAWGYSWIRYRVRGDAEWEAVYSGAVEGLMFFELHSIAELADLATLSKGECVLRLPNGQIASPGGFTGRGNPDGTVARFDLTPAEGVYEVRWYAARGRPRLQEVARFKGTLEPGKMPPTVGPVLRNW